MDRISQKIINDAHFCLWGDVASRHAYSVDAAAGVLVDFNMRFLLSHLHITCGVEKIQHLLIIQLKIHMEREHRPYNIYDKMYIIELFFCI